MMCNRRNDGISMKGIASEKLYAVALVVIVLGVYLRVVHHSFIDFDDNVYIIMNDHVRSGITVRSILWAFKTMYSANWHPLTWLSHMLDVEMYGLHPGGHHMTSVLFHVASSLLLFLFLRESTGRIQESAIVALLFGIHPVHVESVVWVAERKDVLCMFFGLLALISYVRYIRAPSTGKYLGIVFCFALGLLSKPMIVTLPFVMLLLDFWPLHRTSLLCHANGDASPPISSDDAARRLRPNIARLFMEKLPLLILSSISCVVTYIAQSASGAVLSVETLPVGVRIANAMAAYTSYLGKLLFPIDLAIFYPHLGQQLPLWQWLGSSILLVSISILFIRRFLISPFLIIGWLWFLGTLIPVIGLVQVGSQALADRYTYMPAIGIYIIIIWGGREVLSIMKPRKEIVGSFGLVMFICISSMTWNQISLWKNSETLFRHAIAVTENNFLAHNILAVVLGEEGRLEEAYEEYVTSLEMNQQYVDLLVNYGVILVRMGRIEEALEKYRQALSINPDDINAHVNMGKVLTQLQNNDKATLHYNSASEVIAKHKDSIYNNSVMHNSLGIGYCEIGKLDEAIRHFAYALELAPDNPDGHNNMGRVLAQKGLRAEAKEHLYKAIEIQPVFPQALNNLGLVLMQDDFVEDAIYYFARALQQNPEYEKARVNFMSAVLSLCTSYSYESPVH